MAKKKEKAKKQEKKQASASAEVEVKAKGGKKGKKVAEPPAIEQDTGEGGGE